MINIYLSDGFQIRIDADDAYWGVAKSDSYGLPSYQALIVKKDNAEVGHFLHTAIAGWYKDDTSPGDGQVGAAEAVSLINSKA